MIELSHVTKTFGGKKALDELSLRVPQGAVYGLIGSDVYKRQSLGRIENPTEAAAPFSCICCRMMLI